MSPEKIRELLQLGEGSSIEFRSSVSELESLGQGVCGFLNSSGGYLICGVNDTGVVTGLDATPELLARLDRLFLEEISPRTLVQVQALELEDRQVIVIEVPAGRDVPYAFRDVIYVRSGNLTRQAGAAIIRDIVLRRQIEPERWERRLSLADLEQDVDGKELWSAVSDAQKVKRAFFRDASRPKMVLEDLSVARNGRLTHAGDILFTENPAARLPQSRVRALRYHSDQTGDTFDDMKTFEGPLHHLFEDAYAFIVRNTPTVARFLPGHPKRQDLPLYPEDAVREALINALAHRDYSSASGGVSIQVFPRRLEIWNSGSLPEGITTENLPKGHISILRNPDIAHVLYLRGLMEKAGRGSVLMVKRCREAGLADPVWTSDPHLGVSVTFKAPEVTPEVTPEVHRLLRQMQGDCNRQTMMDSLGLRDAEHFRKAYLLPALTSGLIEMTIPVKPRSSKQRYRLTARGVWFLQRG